MKRMNNLLIHTTQELSQIDAYQQGELSPTVKEMEGGEL